MKNQSQPANGVFLTFCNRIPAKCTLLILAAAVILSSRVCLAQQENKSANVKVTPLKKTTISRSIIAYGTVIPAPGSANVFSVPYECRVRKVFVSSGEQVVAGSRLAEITPSKDTQLKVEMAKSAYDTAKARRDEAEKKQQLKLTTNDETLQTRQTFLEAELQLRHYQKMNATGPWVIKAARAGIVDTIYAHESSVIVPDGPLVDVASSSSLEVRLGGEPDEVTLLKTGQSVLLTPVNRPVASPVKGRIRTISRSINTSTRLIDVFVGLSSSTGILLNEYVKGQITTASTEGFIVPRNAVLRAGDQYRLFTVKNNRAVLHYVRTGIENAGEIQVFGKDLTPGDLVVVLGNYELTDKMAVNMEDAR